LCACSLWPKSAPQLNIQITAASYLNPTAGQAKPLRISFYQLKSGFSFMNESYGSLIQSNTLGDALLDKTTIEIRPGQTRNLTLKLQSNTLYLGVIGHYARINHADWRKLSSINTASPPTLFINANTDSLSIKKTHHFWSRL